MARIGAWGLAAGLLMPAACREPFLPERPTPPVAAAAKLNVPLPEGWTAQLDAEKSFRAGPPGRPVLRIDFRRGAGALLPSLAGLRAEFEDASERTLTVLEEVDAPEVRLLVLDAGSADGGLSPILVGARRSGEDLFLCATLPGATATEVDAARSTCEALRSDVPQRK